MYRRRSSRLSATANRAAEQASPSDPTSIASHQVLKGSVVEASHAPEPLPLPAAHPKRVLQPPAIVVKAEPDGEAGSSHGHPVPPHPPPPSNAHLPARKKRKRDPKVPDVKIKVEESATRASKQEQPNLPGPSTSVKVKTDAEIIVGPREGKAKAGKGAADGDEKRLVQFRKSCPRTTMDRVSRVMSQRMFMVDRQQVDDMGLTEQFKVLGSTGNVYTVTIGQLPSCDCPDCRKGNRPCKHILFVFLKVLKVPRNSHTWYQKALLSTELQEIFGAAPDAGAGSEAVSAKIKNAYLRATGAAPAEEQEEATAAEKGAAAPRGRRIISIGEDCPVCYEEMSEKDEKSGKLVYDETLTGCGKPLHRECFNMWAATAAKKGDEVTCVWCRTPWTPAGATDKGKGKAAGGVGYSSNGYLNMADLVGMSRQRDTSTYYWGPLGGQRWNPARYDDD